MPPRTRRGGLRSNPLDAVIPDPAATDASPIATDQAGAGSVVGTGGSWSSPGATDGLQAPVTEQPVVAKVPAPDKPVKFNGYVSLDHADRARDALYVLPGEWTTGRFLERAIDLALVDLAQTYNGGQVFPKRPAGQGLRRGPRIT